MAGTPAPAGSPTPEGDRPLSWWDEAARLHRGLSPGRRAATAHTERPPKNPVTRDPEYRSTPDTGPDTVKTPRPEDDNVPLTRTPVIHDTRCNSSRDPRTRT